MDKFTREKIIKIALENYFNGYSFRKAMLKAVKEINESEEKKMNKVILIGRTTKDPDLNFMPSTGKAVARFQLAVTRPLKKGETDFITCKAFGKTAETIANYITKGRQIAVTGSIRTGSYDAKDGTKKYTTEVWVDSFEFIGNSKGSANNPGGGCFENGFDEEMIPVDDMDSPF